MGLGCGGDTRNKEDEIYHIPRAGERYDFITQAEVYKMAFAKFK